MSDISGRGVGLDIVKDVVNGLRGEISLSTNRGKGAKITLRIHEALPEKIL